MVKTIAQYACHMSCRSVGLLQGSLQVPMQAHDVAGHGGVRHHWVLACNSDWRRC